jgi:hypothetical protein
MMPIEICEEFAERLAKREQELAEHAAQFPFASYKKGDAEASPIRFWRFKVPQPWRRPVEQN